MVPISGYYLGATPTTPMNAPPFTRTAPQAPQHRDSLPSSKPTTPSTAVDDDRLPSPETRARQSETETLGNDLPLVPTIKIESHDDKLNEEELEKARHAPVTSEPRSRSGTMKSDFKFPPPGSTGSPSPPPAVPQIIVGHHDDELAPEPSAEESVERPPVPRKDSTDDDVGETVEVDLN